MTVSRHIDTRIDPTERVPHHRRAFTGLAVAETASLHTTTLLMPYRYASQSLLAACENR